MTPSKRTFTLWMTLTALLLLLGAYVLTASRLRFGGYEVLSYSSVPPEVCPDTLIRLDARIRIDLPRTTKLRRYRLDTYWLNERGGRTEVETFFGDLSNAGEGTRVVPSPVLRQAPADAGRWYLVSMFSYSGTVLGYPRRAMFTLTTPGTILTTLDRSSPQCHS